MWHKDGTGEKGLEGENISLDGDLFLRPNPTSEPNDRRIWLMLACAFSLFMHALILVVMAPKIEELKLNPKAPLEAGIAFKPVVMTAKKHEQIRPSKARYYSDQNQATKREQRARILNAQSRAPPTSARNTARPDRRVARGTRGFKLPTKADFLAVYRPADPLGIRPATVSPKMPGASVSDHLPKVVEGGHAELNTWVWRHAPFFNRIKAQIGQAWAPNIQIARYDPEGVLLGQVDRVTVMSVTINSQGELKEMAVKNSSGVSYLDEEAKRAFKVAAPFPFPPKELFNGPDGFTFSFAFHLKVNRGIKFDFEWNNGD